MCKFDFLEFELHIFFFNLKIEFMRQNRIYDTLLDTNKFFVSMNTSFKLTNYVNKDGLSTVYLYVTARSEKERISIDLLVNPKDWDHKKCIVKSLSENSHDYNLILENIKSKITAIKTVYRLADTHLTPSILKKELLEGMVRVDFNAFVKKSLEEHKSQIKPGTHRRYLAVYHKLYEYKTNIFCTSSN